MKPHSRGSLVLNVTKWLNVKNLSPSAPEVKSWTEVMFCHRSNTLLMPRLYQNTICCEHGGVVRLPDIRGGLLRPSGSIICFSIWILAMSVATYSQEKQATRSVETNPKKRHSFIVSQSSCCCPF